MRSGVLFVGVALFSACNPSKTMVLRARPMEAGVQCPSGGVAIETGRDGNGNGVLDDGEVNASQTTHVCNGQSGDAGINALSVASSEPRGEHCTSGGVRIDTGLDLDSSGTLSAGEVASTRYVCNGQSGDAGINALSVASNEPRGEHCTSGGVRIDTGLDLDSSGTLSVGEVTSTQYVCNPSVPVVYYGDLTIRSDADVAILNGIEVLTGALTIGLSPTPELSFPTLRIIGGRISVTDRSCECSIPNPGVESLSFPALTQLGSLDCTNSTLVSFSAPKLARVGTVNVSNNDALETLALDELAFAEDLSVTNNLVLTTLSLPRLARTNMLTVSSNPALVTLSTQALTAVLSRLIVNSNDNLPLCSVQQLVSRLRAEPFETPSVSGNSTASACAAAEFCDSWPIDGLGTLRVCGWPLALAAARAACQSLGTGADLVWFTSDAEWLAFKAKAKEYATSSWLGYSDEATEGTWVPLNGYSAYSPTSRPDFWESGAAPVDATHTLNGARLTLGTVTAASSTSTEAGFICRVQ